MPTFMSIKEESEQQNPNLQMHPRLIPLFFFPATNRLIMKYFLLPIFLYGALINGYAQVLVSYDKAKGLDISQYKTFQLYKLDVNHTPLFEPRKEGLRLLTGAITEKMQERGFTAVEEDPDIILNVGVTIAQETQTRETDIRDAPMYIGQRRYSWHAEEIVVGTYNEGTVVLDMVDGEKNEMIWQAVVKGVLAEKRSKNEKKIRKGVDKLFKKFPQSP